MRCGLARDADRDRSGITAPGHLSTAFAPDPSRGFSPGCPGGCSHRNGHKTSGCSALLGGRFGALAQGHDLADLALRGTANLRRQPETSNGVDQCDATLLVGARTNALFT